MAKDVYKVVVDGRDGEECYWVFAATKEQAIKKGKLLYLFLRKTPFFRHGDESKI